MRAIPPSRASRTQISVNAGSQIQFKIDTTATAYSIKIYRLGYYQGNGARLMDTDPVGPDAREESAGLCHRPATDIFDCGTWSVSASWNVPATAVSGVYIARLIRSDTGGDSHIPFIVRKDGNTSQVLFQTSDSTWQAYNPYGGSDFYLGNDNGRAYKVSYNRPFTHPRQRPRARLPVRQRVPDDPVPGAERIRRLLRLGSRHQRRIPT